MTCSLYMSWATAIVCLLAVVSSSEGRNVPGNGEQLGSEHQNVGEENDQWSDDTQKIVRPVSYTYFSGNIRDAPNLRALMKSPVGLQQIYGPSFSLQTGSEMGKVKSLQRWNSRISSDNIRQQSHAAPYQEKTLPPVSRKTVRFPLNTVLPGNSLSFDHKQYPGLIQAVNAFSDLAPSRKPDEGVVVTHDTVSLPPTSEGVVTASRTRITNHGAHGNGSNYPYREFSETTHNTHGDRSSVIERTQLLRVHEHLGEDPAETYASSKIGGAGGGPRFDSAQGDSEEDEDQGEDEKRYRKEHNHYKEAKRYREKERDSSDSEETSKQEKKFGKDELYEENLTIEKDGKGNKHGEGGNRKKGRKTYSKRIVKKDEFIKNTKFYDEDDDGGGESDGHGELYDTQEEKNGGGEEENNHEKKSPDGGHEEVQGRKEDSNRKEDLRRKKRGHAFTKWRQTIGDRRR